MLRQSSRSNIRSMLYAAGLRTFGDGEQIVIAALKAADPEAEIVAVRHRGWHRIAGHADPIFVGEGDIDVARHCRVDRTCRAVPLRR